MILIQGKWKEQKLIWLYLIESDKQKIKILEEVLWINHYKKMIENIKSHFVNIIYLLIINII